MAYKTKSRSRKPAARKRVYRKKRNTKTKRVTNKRIANVASTKKQDTMQGAVKVNGTWANNSIQIANDGGNHTLLWCPSGRDRDVSEYQRNRQKVWAKGVSDRFTITTPDATVWVWRRIVFRSYFRYTSALSSNGSTDYRRNMQLDDPQHASVAEDLFQGSNGFDWVDPFNAKCDRQRMQIVYDKTKYVRPHASLGDVRVFKNYHPVNGTLTYDDEERGGDMISSPWCVNAGQRNGNLYVFDIIKSNNTAGTGPMRVFADSTWYWHES